MERIAFEHRGGKETMNTIPNTYQKADGWYWETATDSNGPFTTEDAALNDYVDSHECEEE